MRARPSRGADDGSHRFCTRDARDLRNGAQGRPIADSSAIIPSAFRARGGVRAVALGSRWGARGDTADSVGRLSAGQSIRLNPQRQHSDIQSPFLEGRSERAPKPAPPKPTPAPAPATRELADTTPTAAASPSPPAPSQPAASPAGTGKGKKKAKHHAKSKGKPTQPTQPPQPPVAATTPQPANESPTAEGEKDHGNGKDKDKDKGKGKSDDKGRDG